MVHEFVRIRGEFEFERIRANSNLHPYPLPTGCGCGGCRRGDPSPTQLHALLRAGFARCGCGTRAPGGGTSCLGVGHPGSGALPTPTACPWSVRPGPATHLLWVRGLWAWGPVTDPTACTLASWLCAPWWRHEGGGGGGASCLGVGRPGLGTLPRPTARPTGLRPGPASHWLWVWGLWAWRPVADATPRALARWLCALVGRQDSAPGGLRLLPGFEAPRVGRSPRPDRPSLREAAGARYPLAVGAGAVRLGTLHQPHSARSCELALRVVGAARGRPGGGRLLPWFRASGVELSQARQPVLGACSRGPLPTSCGCGGGVGVGTCHQPHCGRSSELASRAVGAAQGRPE